MKRFIVTSAAVLLLGALAACQTATPYQPLHAGSTSGGYSETRIEADRWRVGFKGNEDTSRETVETYLLYRAAELTIAQGFDWFEPMERHTDKKVEYQSDGFYGGFGYGYWGPRWRRFGWGGYGGGYWGDPFFDENIDEKFAASAEIFMGHGPKPADDRRAMDAREVMSNLRSHVVLPTK